MSALRRPAHAAAGLSAVAQVTRRYHRGGALVRCHPRRLSAILAFAGLVLLLSLILAAAPRASTRGGGLRSVRAQAKALATDVAALDAKIDAAVLRSSQATTSLLAVQEQIAENRRLQALALRNLEVARATLAARAVALYKHDDVTTLDALFSASDFNDLVGQITMVRSVARGDRDIVRSVEHTQRELADRALSLAADERTAKKLVALRDAEVRNIRARLGERQAMLAGAHHEIRDLAARQRAAKPAAAEAVEPPSGGGAGGGSGGSAADSSGGGSATDAGDPAGQGEWWPLIQQAAGDNGVSARGMYRLMMVESGGYASIVGPGGFYGLFQYGPSTWKGPWNPYRAADITDGAAQIRATALALKMGYGHAWWDPSYSWAFSGR